MVCGCVVYMKQSTLIRRLQQVMDHFHQGRVLHVERLADQFLVQTTRGDYIVVEHPEDAVLARWQLGQQEATSEAFGQLERLLLPNFKGVLTPRSSYAHQEGRYYSIYAVTSVRQPEKSKKRGSRAASSQTKS